MFQYLYNTTITSEILLELGNPKQATSTFISDATRIWNKVPVFIKNIETLHAAKIKLKKYVKTLPV